MYRNVDGIVNKIVYDGLVPSPKIPTRARRSAQDARAIILDAAELRLARLGPDGLRVADIAADAGLTHPTVLHHFGNRDGLVAAVNDRTVEALKRALMDGLKSTAAPRSTLVPRVFAAFRNGLARRLVWLGQSDRVFSHADRAMIQDIADAVHASRIVEAPGLDRADTAHLVHLVIVAAFGDAILGRALRAPASGDDDAGAARFETWLRSLFGDHLHRRSRT